VNAQRERKGSALRKRLALIGFAACLCIFIGFAAGCFFVYNKDVKRKQKERKRQEHADTAACNTDSLMRKYNSDSTQYEAFFNSDNRWVQVFKEGDFYHWNDVLDNYLFLGILQQKKEIPLTDIFTILSARDTYLRGRIEELEKRVEEITADIPKKKNFKKPK